MISKGRTFGGTFRLKKEGSSISVSGLSFASFGYKLGAADGVWVDWKWENGRFELRNDRLGFYPMFYRRDSDGFSVSSDIAALLERSSAFDDAAMAVFLRLGFFLGDDTPFKAIRAVAPGSVMTWEAGDFRLSAGGLPRGSAAPSLSRDAAVDEYARLFQAAVERHSNGAAEKAALPLSGGRDSRHILFSLLKAKRPPQACLTAIHLPPRPNEDARIAAAVARFDGLAHAVLPQAGNLFAAELEKNRLTNLCADEHTWIMPLRAYLKRHAFTVAYDGIGGDILSAGLYLTEESHRRFEKGELRAIAEDLLGPEGYLAATLTPEYHARWSRAAALERLEAELARHRGAANPTGQFYFWNRTRREIAASPWGILNESCHVFAPYLTAEVYDFLSALPAEFFFDHTFHTETIARAFPERASLAYEAKGLPSTKAGRGAIAAFGLAAAGYCASSPLVKSSFILPRLAKGLANAEYGTNMRIQFNRAVYLSQLGRLRKEAARP